jgi:hypothetical protein
LATLVTQWRKLKEETKSGSFGGPLHYLSLHSLGAYYTTAQILTHVQATKLINSFFGI